MLTYNICRSLSLTTVIPLLLRPSDLTTQPHTVLNCFPLISGERKRKAVDLIIGSCEGTGDVSDELAEQ